MIFENNTRAKLSGKWKLLSEASDVQISIQFLEKNPFMIHNAVYIESQIFQKKIVKKAVIPFCVDYSSNGKLIRFKYINTAKIEIFKVDYLHENALKLTDLQTDSKFQLIRNE